MNKISYHLILVNSSLRVLIDQVDKLCECIELQIDGDQHPVIPYNMQKIKTKNEPQINKNPSFAEASASRFKPEKSILDSVYESIKRTRKGVTFFQIQKKTGFNRKQIANAIYKLKEKGMIVSKKRGVYVKR